MSTAKPIPSEITQAQFLVVLMERFPAVAEDVLEDEGLIHLQVGSLAWYANACVAKGRLDEVARIIQFFQQTVEKVDSTLENALYVAFLEHLAFEGDSQNAQQARLLLAPPYRDIWRQLRAG